MPTRRHGLFALAAGGALLGAACASRPPIGARDELVARVRAAEEGFAATMARRDLRAFGEFVSDDAVFVNSGNPLRGKDAIVAFWARFFVPQEAAPFSWRPELVEVASAGTLGYTEGPVMSPAGEAFARFHTTWQINPGGRWLVVFDNGTRVCKS